MEEAQTPISPRYHPPTSCSCRSSSCGFRATRGPRPSYPPCSGSAPNGVVQELLEHAVTDFLERDHDRYSPRWIAGYRNSYKPKTLTTVAGRLPVQVPQVRDTTKPFQS